MCRATLSVSQPLGKGSAYTSTPRTATSSLRPGNLGSASVPVWDPSCNSRSPCLCPDILADFRQCHRRRILVPAEIRLPQGHPGRTRRHVLLHFHRLLRPEYHALAYLIGHFLSSLTTIQIMLAIGYHLCGWAWWVFFFFFQRIHRNLY